MKNLQLIIMVLVFAAAFVLILVGILGTEHPLPTRFGEPLWESYLGSDPERIREYSFA